MSDADIEMLVFAAEAAGHSIWLQGGSNERQPQVCQAGLLAL